MMKMIIVDFGVIASRIIIIVMNMLIIIFSWFLRHFAIVPILKDITLPKNLHLDQDIICVLLVVALAVMISLERKLRCHVTLKQVQEYKKLLIE